MNLGSASRRPKRRAATTKAAKPTAPKDALRSQLRETVTATILDAAEERFAAQGLTAAPLAEIAKAAGVAVGTLYNYFADREALVAGLLDNRRATLKPQLDAALQLGKDKSFEPRLRDITRGLFEAFDRNRNYMKIVFQAEHLHKHGSNKPDLFTTIEQQVVAAGVAEGVIDKRDAETFVMLYTGSIRSVIIRSIANNTAFAEKADPIVTLLLDGARRKP